MAKIGGLSLQQKLTNVMVKKALTEHIAEHK
jgi:hypothetical protein